MSKGKRLHAEREIDAKLKDYVAMVHFVSGAQVPAQETGRMTMRELSVLSLVVSACKFGEDERGIQDALLAAYELGRARERGDVRNLDTWNAGAEGKIAVQVSIQERNHE